MPIYASIWHVHHGYQMFIHVANLILLTLNLTKFHLDQALSMISLSLKNNQIGTFILHCCCMSSSRGKESIFLLLPSFIKVRGVFPLLEPWSCYLWKLDFIACCVDVQNFIATALDGIVWYVVFLEFLRLKMSSLGVKT